MVYCVLPAFYTGIYSFLEYFYYLTNVALVICLLLIPSAKYYEYKISFRASVKLCIIILFFAYITCWLIVSYFFLGFNVLKFFSAGYKEMEAIRRNVYNFNGIAIMIIEFFPVLLISLMFYLKVKLRWIIICFAFFCLAILSFGSRGQIMNYIITLLLSLSIHRGAKFSFSKIIMVFLLITCSFTLMTWIKFGGMKVAGSVVVEAVLHRMSMGAMQAVAVMERATVVGFEYGYSYVRDIFSLTPIVEIGTNKFMSIMVTGFSDYGNFTPTLIGEAFWNFSYSSILLATLFLIFMFFIERFSTAHHFLIILYPILGTLLIKICVNGFSGNITLFLSMIILLIMMFLAHLLLRVPHD